MGLFFDAPKSMAKATETADGPITPAQLAEVEENILRQMDKLAERLGLGPERSDS